MAEAILVHMLGPGHEASVDSAGTGAWHTGEEPDRRTQLELARNGTQWVSTARQVQTADFEEFDHLVAMDHQNLRDLLRWPGAEKSRVSLLMDWAGETDTPVPDPYYGGSVEFRLVYDMCHRACLAIRSRLFTPNV